VHAADSTWRSARRARAVTPAASSDPVGKPAALGQVVAVQLNEVEGVEEYVLVSAVVTDEIERGNAVVIAGDSFAVDNARARAQPGERINDQREAAGEVIAGPAVELHLRAGAFFPRQTANIFANQLGGTRRNGLARRHSDIGIVVNEVTHRVGPDVCRCEKIPKSNSKNNGPPRMETSGRTAGPTRGWMGAHAPITTVFVPGT